jgi:hypothetical protein
MPTLRAAPSALPLADIPINISGYSFGVPARYSPGHSLNETEAQALNGLVADNIRENVRKWVSGALEETPEGLGPEAQASLASRIRAYAARYSLSPSRPAPRPTPVQAELLAMAIERGTTPEALARNGDLVLEAQRRASAKLAVAQRDLWELLGAGP